MSVDVNYINPQYGIALNKEEMRYFLLHVKYSKELFPYIDLKEFENMNKKIFIGKDEQEYSIDDFLNNIGNSLYDSDIVVYEGQFSLYGDRDEGVFTAMNGEEDNEHYYFSLFLLYENKINYKNLSFGYINESEMINEIKNKYAYALPNDFEWESHLGFVEGFYYD